MEVYLLLVLFFCPTLISSIPVRFYTNAWYEPATASDLLVTLTSITTFHQCACQCYNYSSCLTGAFSNINQTCSLYSLSINSSELRWTFDEFSFVFDFLTKTPATPSSMEWNFNQTFNDKYSVYNGQLISNSVNRKKRDRSNQEQILWISSAFNEGDTAVQFLSNSYCLINPTFNFNPTSFTITARIYIPTSLVADAEYFPLFSHCQSLTIDHCLYAVVEKNGLRLGFYNDDLVGQTPLNANQWYHVAFVYDQAASEQRVYLNGILDGSRKSNASYAGGENHIILGPLLMMSNITFLNGYIEKITFDSYVKTESELLTDATSVAYYPFDNSYLDAGPDHVDNTLPVSTTFYANGHLHQALLFNSETSAYFRIIGLFYLGLVNYPFSISLWISPFSSSGTILQLSSHDNWCLALLGFNSNGYLVAQSYDGESIQTITSTSAVSSESFTHVSIRYSQGNGLQFYVNGDFIENTTSPLVYVASNQTTTMTLGISQQSDGCEGSQSQTSLTQYQGGIDELKIFSRELSAEEIRILAEK